MNACWGWNNVNRRAVGGLIYRADGAFSDVRNVVVLDRNMLDYTFANAPVDWLGDGNWMPTERAGLVRRNGRSSAVGAAAMRCSGISSVSPAINRCWRSWRRRWNIRARERNTISATATSASPSVAMGTTRAAGMPRFTARRIQQGHENQRTVLLRNGVEVASTPIPAMTFLEGAHHEWFGLNLQQARQHD